MFIEYFTKILLIFYPKPTKNMRPIFCLAICILFFSCNKNADNNGNSANTPPPLNRDSLQQVYEQIVFHGPDLMPTEQIIEAGKLYPVDAGQKDTSFFVFRDHLFGMIAQRDELGLLEHVAEDVISDAEGENTLAAFVEYWQLDTQKDSSELWLVLENTLEQGGTFSNDNQQFIAPYSVSTFPENYEPEIFGAITGEGVRVREAPSLNSRILNTISYDIVQVLEYTEQTETIGRETHPWVKIKLPDDEEGFVYGKYVGRPSDTRAVFTRQPGNRWLLTELR